MPRSTAITSRGSRTQLAKKPSLKTPSQVKTTSRTGAATATRKTSKASSGCGSEWSSISQPGTKTRAKVAVKGKRR